MWSPMCIVTVLPTRGPYPDQFAVQFAYGKLGTGEKEKEEEEKNPC